MRKAVSFFVLLGLAAMPALAAVEIYKDVSVVDVNCSKKVAADPDSHTRACALKCAAGGYGIVTKGKQFLKFDAEGNTKIDEDVSGDVQGDTLKVTSIKLL
jgi:hypothetical protein